MKISITFPMIAVACQSKLLSKILLRSGMLEALASITQIHKHYAHKK